MSKIVFELLPEGSPPTTLSLAERIPTLSDPKSPYRTDTHTYYNGKHTYIHTYIHT